MVRMRPLGSRVICQPPSWTIQWWRGHSSTRVLRVVRPPRLQWVRWWASLQEVGRSQPGHWQHWSRTLSALRVAPGTTRWARPTSTMAESGPNSTRVTLASQASRSTMRAEIGRENSSSAALAPGLPRRVSSAAGRRGWGPLAGALGNDPAVEAVAGKLDQGVGHAAILVAVVVGTRLLGQRLERGPKHRAAGGVEQALD